MSDLRFALRQLARSPVFAATAVLSLALGIGANTAVFSLVNAILLGTLPVPHPHELRVIRWSGVAPKIAWFSGSWNRGGGAGQRDQADSFSYPVFRALREAGSAQAAIFGFTGLHGINVRARHEPFAAEGLMVSDNFFAGLGVNPIHGRLFAPGDDDASAAPIAVISHGWWEKEFGLAPDVLGQTVSLNGHAFTIVGVLPREFRGVGLADENEFYVPMSAQPRLAPNLSRSADDRWWVHAMARVRPAGDQALQAALDVRFATQVEQRMSAPRIEISAGHAGPAHDQLLYRRPLTILLSVVGVVILVACANLAGLSLARGAARQHEFAVRVNPIEALRSE